MIAGLHRDPIHMLMEEHRIIEKVLHAMGIVAARLKAAHDVPPALLEDAIEFVRNFADRCHHGKEEGHLFPALEAEGLPSEGGPVGMMLAEHDSGRAYVRGLVEAVNRYKAGDKEARSAMLVNMEGYVELLKQHIWKEDNVLFRMASQVLSEQRQRQLAKRFEDMERLEIGVNVHERYARLADELREEAARLGTV